MGNTVVTFSDKDEDDEISTLLEDEEVLRRTHYYPFGMTMDLPLFEDFNDPENGYLYNDNWPLRSKIDGLGNLGKAPKVNLSGGMS